MGPSLWRVLTLLSLPKFCTISKSWGTLVYHPEVWKCVLIISLQIAGYFKKCSTACFTEILVFFLSKFLHCLQFSLSWTGQLVDGCFFGSFWNFLTVRKNNFLKYTIWLLSISISSETLSYICLCCWALHIFAIYCSPACDMDPVSIEVLCIILIKISLNWINATPQNLVF